MEFNHLGVHHYTAVKEIYELGIAGGNATFQTKAPSWEEWDKGHLPSCRIVVVELDQVLGWAALAPVSGRRVYVGVAEVSIYVHPDAQGRGVGSTLLLMLIKQSEDAGIWTLQAGIFPENYSSLKLHFRCGFREVGYRERIGKMSGQWRNTILLERRSSIVGI